MRLPPLNALRAFEAAARHGGFIGAAEELHVTRGAISRHVRLLEDHLGRPLFRRHARGVDLTAEGARLRPVLTEVFGRIARETAALAASDTELRLICPPTISIRWLFPRLEIFRAAHPGIGVRLTTDFYGREGFDPVLFDLGFSVAHRPGRAPEIAVEPLFPIRLSPACTPGLARRLASNGPAGLAGVPLLHESADRSDWTNWLNACGVGDVDPTSGEVFPNLDMAVKAALMGAGVVMAEQTLCADELSRGELVLPFPDMVCGAPEEAFALIGPRERWEEPPVRAFRDWAHAEAARHR